MSCIAFKLGNDGNCTSCKRMPNKNEDLQCRSCKHIFHVSCPNVSTDQKVASKSAISAYLQPSTKPNLLFLCDVCLTNFEIANTGDDSKRVNILEEKVDKFDKKLDEITCLLKDPKCSQKTV